MEKVPNKNILSPQEKKQLSYLKDRRNVYGENSKASRRLIPLYKAIENRDIRRKSKQSIALLSNSDEEKSNLLESNIKKNIAKIGGWKKSSDMSLGEFLQRKKSTKKTQEQ